MITGLSNENICVNISGNNNNNNFIINGLENKIDNSQENSIFKDEVFFKDDINIAENKFIKIENNYNDNITQSGIEFRLPDNKSVYLNIFALIQLEEQLNTMINKINELAAGHDDICLLDQIHLLYLPSSN